MPLVQHGNCPAPKQERRSLAGLLQSRSIIKDFYEQLKSGLLCPKKDISRVTKADAKSGLDSSTYVPYFGFNRARLIVFAA